MVLVGLVLGPQTFWCCFCYRFKAQWNSKLSIQGYNKHGTDFIEVPELLLANNHKLCFKKTYLNSRPLQHFI